MKTPTYILSIFGLFCSLVASAQKIDFKADTQQGCDSVTTNFSFTTTIASVTSIEWRFGDGTPVKKSSLSPKKDTTHTYYPGKYTVVLKLNGTDSVKKIDYIKVGKTPKAFFVYKDTFDYGSFNLVFWGGILDTSILFPYTFHWNINGDTLSNQRYLVHSFDSEGTYPGRLIVNDAFGCADTVFRQIDVKNAFDINNIPNVFSPNNDGVNDEFVIPSNGKYILSFKVFAKSGILVYQTEAKMIRWDGHINSGDLASPGMYYYIIETENIKPTIKRAGFLYIYR